ncbi:lysophospholipid acyltransferase family protein [Deltaproteobacteria bacterium TL4]
MDIKNTLKKIFPKSALDDIIRSVNKEVGSMGYDPWGYQEEVSAMGLKFIEWFYDHYFRVEAFGMENIPKKGGVLLIANHSGQLPMDGILIGAAVALKAPSPRATRAMIERFFPTVPFVGNIMNQVGAVVGDPSNCIRMLACGEVVTVFPEGVGGSGKPWEKRYQLQRFGSGFMHIAMKTQVPIIPVGVVGCEETMPSFGSFDKLAKVLGLPMIPITLPVILPAKVYLHFGKPLSFDANTDSEEEIMNRVEQVKDEIRALIEIGLEKRERIY